MTCALCGSDDPKVMRPRGPGQRYCDGEFHLEMPSPAVPDPQAWNDAWAEYYAEQEWPQEIAARIGEAMWLARQDDPRLEQAVDERTFSLLRKHIDSLRTTNESLRAENDALAQELDKVRQDHARRNIRLRYLTSSRERWIAVAGVSWVCTIGAVGIALLSAAS